VDARPELSARANQAARGMGFENTPQYKQVSLPSLPPSLPPSIFFFICVQTLTLLSLPFPPSLLHSPFSPFLSLPPS